MSTSLLGSLVRRPLIVIAADATVLNALAVARCEHLHHLPVVRDTLLVGLVCTCDLDDAALESRVDAVMSYPVVALTPGDSLHDAALAMRDNDIGSVVLIENGRACGIVTRGDLLSARPELEAVLGKTRCECCGLTRHLRRNERGDTLCIYCLKPSREGLADNLI
jgi:predicted transcriptional regulator